MLIYSKIYNFLNLDITMSLKQFIRNMLISISIFFILPYIYYLQGGIFLIIISTIYILLFFTLLSLLKNWYLFIAIPGLLFSSIITPYMIITKSNISYSVMASIYDTDYQEITEFMTSEFSLKYMILFFSIILIPFSINDINFITTKIYIKIKPIFSLVLLSIILSGVYYQLKQKQIKTVSENVSLWRFYPLHDILLMKRFLYDNKYFIYEYKNSKFDSTVIEDKDNNISVILVIGEADRKSSWQLYGSQYNTTPYLTSLIKNDTEAIVPFSNMVTVAPFTRVAVPSLFSLASEVNYHNVPFTPSLYRVLKKTKINTIFISRRNSNSFHNNLITEMVKDNKIINKTKKKYDGDLLPLIYTQINKNEKKLITVHLSGSHYKYKIRYPNKYTCYEPSISDANYLSSVRYTNSILTKIIKKMKEQKNPYILIYTPDHGEYVNDNGDYLYGHGFKDLTRNELEIPLVFIFNNKFLEKHTNLVRYITRNQNKGVSLNNISHSVLGLLGVKDLTFYDKSYDLSSKDFSEHPRFIIDRDLNINDLKKIIFVPLSNNEKGIRSICKDN